MDHFLTYRQHNSIIGVANGSPLAVVGIGSVALSVTDTNGQTQTLILDDVLHVPALKFNLYSMRGALHNEKHHIDVTADRIAITTPQGLCLHATPHSRHGLFSFASTSAVPTPYNSEALKEISDSAIIVTSHISHQTNIDEEDIATGNIVLVTQSSLQRALLEKRGGHFLTPFEQCIKIRPYSGHFLTPFHNSDVSAIFDDTD